MCFCFENSCATVQLQVQALKDGLLSAATCWLWAWSVAGSCCTGGPARDGRLVMDTTGADAAPPTSRILFRNKQKNKRADVLGLEIWYLSGLQEVLVALVLCS